MYMQLVNNKKKLMINCIHIHLIAAAIEVFFFQYSSAGLLPLRNFYLLNKDGESTSYTQPHILQIVYTAS